MADEGVRLKDRFEARPGVACPVPDLGELFEVSGDLTIMPGDADRFDVGKVLIKRGPSDAGRLGDLRHRHRCQPTLGDKRRGGVQRRVADRAAVCLDRLVLQLRHRPTVRSIGYDTY